MMRFESRSCFRREISWKGYRDEEQDFIADKVQVTAQNDIKSMIQLI